jgi:hypothetical protein
MEHDRRTFLKATGLAGAAAVAALPGAGEGRDR